MEAPLAPLPESDPRADPWAGVTGLSGQQPPDPWAGAKLSASPPAAPDTKKNSFVKYLSDTAAAVALAFKGENEHDYPELLGSGSPFTEGARRGAVENINKGGPFLESNKSLKIMGKLMNARGEEAMLDILKKEIPDMPPPSKDKFGNMFVTVDGHKYYLNRSGLSERDLGELTRDTLITAPFSAGLGLFTRGLSMIARAPAQGLAGALGSVTEDINSAAAGGEQGLDVTALIASAIGGAGGEAVGSAIGGVVSKIRERPSLYVDVKAGILTPQGAALFQQAGFDPADITQKVSDAFSKRAGKTGANPATARDVAAAEFGIFNSEGQATGDVQRQAFEQAAKAGARGEAAQKKMRGDFALQAEDITAAGKSIADEFAPSVRTESPQKSAGAVLEGVRNQFDEMSADKNANYKLARSLAKGASVPKAELETLPQFARDSVKAIDGRILPDLHKGANIAMGYIEKLGAGELEDVALKSGNAVGPMGPALDALEGFRQTLNEVYTSAERGTRDRVLTGRVVKGFDDWLDHVSDNALMKGDPDAVVALRGARRKAADIFNKFYERKPGDDAGKVIERMIDREIPVTENEVANWLWGSNKIGDSGQAFRVAKRIKEIVGEQSPEWEALRRGMFQKIVSEAEGRIQPGPQAVSQNLFEFLNGKGSALAKELFDPTEQAKVRRFATVLKNLVPSPDATNPSKSGYEIGRMIRDILGSDTLPAIRIFGGIAGIPAHIKAYRTGAPVMRTPPPAIVPAAGAAAGQQYLTAE